MTVLDEKMKKINYQSLEKMRRGVETCNGPIVLGNAFYTYTTSAYLSKTERDKYAKIIESLIDKFANNCYCIKIKDEEVVFKTKLPPLDDEVKKNIDEVKVALSEKTQECNCVDILNLIPSYVNPLMKKSKQINRNDNLAITAVFELEHLFKNWDNHCICRKKGIGSYSDSIGRYKK